MPGTVRPIVDERDGLLAFLAQQRDALCFAVHGLTDEQAASKPTASALSLAGLIKHAARTERGWIVEMLAQHDSSTVAETTRDWEAEFRLEEGETVARLLDAYARWLGRPRRSSPRSPTSASRCRFPRACHGSPTTWRRGRHAGCCST